MVITVSYLCVDSSSLLTGEVPGLGRWTEDDLEFPFTLSALTRLKELSISA